MEIKFSAEIQLFKVNNWQNVSNVFLLTGSSLPRDPLQKRNFHNYTSNDNYISKSNPHLISDSKCYRLIYKLNGCYPTRKLSALEIGGEMCSTPQLSTVFISSIAVYSWTDPSFISKQRTSWSDFLNLMSTNVVSHKWNIWKCLILVLFLQLLIYSNLRIITFVIRTTKQKQQGE